MFEYIFSYCCVIVANIFSFRTEHGSLILSTISFVTLLHDTTLPLTIFRKLSLSKESIHGLLEASNLVSNRYCVFTYYLRVYLSLFFLTKSRFTWKGLPTQTIIRRFRRRFLAPRPYTFCRCTAHHHWPVPPIPWEDISVPDRSLRPRLRRWVVYIFQNHTDTNRYRFPSRAIEFCRNHHRWKSKKKPIVPSSRTEM